MAFRRWFGLAGVLILLGALSTACSSSGGGADFASCKGTSGEKSSAKPPGGETADGAGTKVGVALDIGSKNDKSFNQAALEGLTAAERDFKVTGKFLEPNPDGSNREELLRTLAEDGNKLVFGVGFAFAEGMQKVAKDFPETSFAIIDDASFKAPNVTSLVFTEEQGSYLVGVAAAKATKSKKIGFIGGVNTDLIKKFEAGYKAGAASVDKDITVEVKYISEPPDFSGFNNSSSAKTIAQGMYNRDVDVIYPAAGGSGIGVFPVAEKEDRLVIGVDSDQYQQFPAGQQKCTLTSMLKRVDLAVYTATQEFVDKKLATGEQRFDLKTGLIGYATDGGQIDDFKDDLATAQKDITSGKVKVPTTP